MLDRRVMWLQGAFESEIRELNRMIEQVPVQTCGARVYAGIYAGMCEDICASMCVGMYVDMLSGAGQEAQGADRPVRDGAPRVRTHSWHATRRTQ